MNQPIDPKVILITGCSSGFGLLAAARLSAGGHNVFATMRDVAKNQALLEEVRKRGGHVEVLQLDVTNPASVQKAVAEAVKKFGRIDVLINNAGYGIGGFFEDLADDEIRKQMEVNFFGVQNVTRQVVPIMRQKGAGRIINISSVAGFSASPCFGAYNASKWALEGFSESLRHELRFFGIDVLLVEPGTFPTKIFDDNARYARDFNRPNSPYFHISQFLRTKVLKYVHHCKKDPERVAYLIEQLVVSPSPAFRNHPDAEARMLYTLRKILPFRLYAWILRKTLFQDFRFPH